MQKGSYWCPLCKANKDGEFLVIGLRNDNMNGHRVCPHHVPDEHQPQNNANHRDGTVRDLVFEDLQA